MERNVEIRIDEFYIFRDLLEKLFARFYTLKKSRVCQKKLYISQEY